MAWIAGIAVLSWKAKLSDPSGSSSLSRVLHAGARGNCWVSCSLTVPGVLATVRGEVIPLDPYILNGLFCPLGQLSVRASTRFQFLMLFSYGTSLDRQTSMERLSSWAMIPRLPASWQRSLLTSFLSFQNLLRSSWKGCFNLEETST